MKILQKLLITFFTFFVFAQFAHAETPTVYFYYGDGCPHCAQVEPFIEKMSAKYPDLEIMQYEVYHNRVNSSRLIQAFEDHNVPSNKRGVPVVFINGTYFLGDSPILNNLENEITKIIEKSQIPEPEISIPEVEEDKIVVSFQTKETSTDPLPEVEESNEIEVAEENIEKDLIIEDKIIETKDTQEKTISPWQDWHWWLIFLVAFVVFYGLYKLWTTKKTCICLSEKQKDFIIIGGAIIFLIAFFTLAKNISPDFLEEVGYNLPLPIFTFFIALIDGFNPCNLFVLTFLLALLTSASHSKGRIYAVGFTFVLMVFAIYFLFMAAWLNIFKYIGFITPLRIAIAMIALIAGAINCKELLFFRKGITLMIQDKHKGPLVRRIERMKEVIEKGTVPVLISSSIALAAFASLVELPCTAGFPIIYTGILSAKLLSGLSYYAYLALYNFFYVLPLAVVIGIFGYTLQGRKISQRQMQIIKFIGGFIMIVLGIILLINPSIIGIAS